MSKKLPIIYSDFFSSFDINPITGDLALVTNADAIKQSIRNLIYTNFFDRSENPIIGSQVRYSLFENFNSITAEELKNDIITTVSNFEKRASLQSVTVTDDVDNNSVTINIVFICVVSPVPISFDIYVNRTH